MCFFGRPAVIDVAYAAKMAYSGIAQECKEVYFKGLSREAAEAIAEALHGNSIRIALCNTLQFDHRDFIFAWNNAHPGEDKIYSAWQGCF